MRLIGAAVVVFVAGASGAIIGIERYHDAYAWVAHTSDVRLQIGRAIGDSGRAVACVDLRRDVETIAQLTVDNEMQQRRVLALRLSVESACARRSTPALLDQLVELDTTERSLMSARRTHLESVWVWTLAAFTASILVGVATLAIAFLLNARGVRALMASEERFRLLATKASDLIRIHDATGQATYASPSCERLLGYTPAEMTATRAIALGHPDDLPLMREALAQIQKPYAPSITVRYRLRARSGSYRWFETHTDPVHDDHGRLVRFYTLARDITDRLQAEHDLEQLTVTDELTALLNRRGFMLLGAQEHRVALRQKLGVAVVFADLDGLKAINDHQGHEAGDRAIVRTADLLRATFRESDVAARLGGDEFAALLYDVDAAKALLIAARIQAAIDAANTEDPSVVLAVSIGIAVMAPGTQRPLEELLAEADAQMYLRKRARRSERAAAAARDHATRVEPDRLGRTESRG